MKKIIAPIFLATGLILAACNSHTTERGMTLAQNGQTKLEYTGFNSNTKILHASVIQSLNERRWTVSDSGNPIKAEIKHGGQHAIVAITVFDDKISIDTKGSYIETDGHYVPLRYIDYLVASTRKNLKATK
jgi:hypothetical protein